MSATRHRSSIFSSDVPLGIGRLVPLVIGLSFALDAATRLVPIDMFAFRAWESLMVRRGPTGPFEPNRVYVNPMTYGDLARAQRYRQLRQHHLEYFSTDAWGFRNTGMEADARPVRWLLIGDSFGVSSGVRDSATLAAQLARASGERVYNASSFGPIPLGDIRFTANRLGITAGLVIYEYMERQPMASAPPFDEGRIFGDGPPPSRGIADRFDAWRKDAAVSRMSILAGWGWDILDAAFNTPAAKPGGAAPQQGELPTEVYELQDGASMLFFTGDDAVARDRDRRISPEYLVWLHSQLAKSNLQLAVLIAPTKYQVYGPLVKDPAAIRPSESALQRLADELNRRGVLAVNLTEPLRRQAAEDLKRHQYLYFLDDTHWNDRGIATAARVFAAAAAGRF